MVLHSSRRQQVLITNTVSKSHGIVEGAKSYGKKEKGEGEGIQDCRKQVKILDTR